MLCKYIFIHILLNFYIHTKVCKWNFSAENICILSWQILSCWLSKVELIYTIAMYISWYIFYLFVKIVKYSTFKSLPTDEKTRHSFIIFQYISHIIINLNIFFIYLKVISSSSNCLFMFLAHSIGIMFCFKNKKNSGKYYVKEGNLIQAKFHRWEWKKPLLFKGFNYFTRKREFSPLSFLFILHPMREPRKSMWSIINIFCDLASLLINQLLAQKINGQL